MSHCTFGSSSFMELRTELKRECNSWCISVFLASSLMHADDELDVEVDSDDSEKLVGEIVLVLALPNIG